MSITVNLFSSFILTMQKPLKILYLDCDKLKGK
jgi:hypothetical protein